MTRSKYFFYPKAEDERKRGAEREAERMLPTEHSEELAPPSFAFRAGSKTLSRPIERSAEKLAATILSDLTAIRSRMSSKKSVAPFSSLLSLLLDFCEEYPTVTARKTIHRDVCAATCTHNLLFAIGTVIHYASANSMPIELIGGEDKDGPMILLRAESGSMTPEEAAAQFGLSPYRLSVLRSIAAASDFSLEIIAAERSTICFRIPIYTPDTYRVFALTDPSFRAAFMQPLVYFIF